MPHVNRYLMSGDNVDLIGTLDFKEIAGNFLIFKPTLLMRKVYGEVYRRFEDEYNRREIVRKDPASVSYMNNDQSLLTRLVLYDSAFRSKYPVSFRVLDAELFTCGKWYDGQDGMYSSARSRSPILINNNYVGIDLKKQRLLKHGHWFIRDGRCDHEQVKAAMSKNEDRLPKSEARESFYSYADMTIISDAINAELNTNNK